MSDKTNKFEFTNEPAEKRQLHECLLEITGHVYRSTMADLFPSRTAAVKAIGCVGIKSDEAMERAYS